jgi:hypothetical protein
MTQTWRNVTVPSSGETTLYIRMMRWNSGPFDWPPGDLKESPSLAAGR